MLAVYARYSLTFFDLLTWIIVCTLLTESSPIGVYFEDIRLYWPIHCALSCFGSSSPHVQPIHWVPLLEIALYLESSKLYCPIRDPSIKCCNTSTVSQSITSWFSQNFFKFLQNVIATRANASREKKEPQVTTTDGQPTTSTSPTRTTWEERNISNYGGLWAVCRRHAGCI